MIISRPALRRVKGPFFGADMFTYMIEGEQSEAHVVYDAHQDVYDLEVLNKKPED